jgi:single-strand DNA-binding protein
MLNKIMLIGNLGRDPEMSYTPNGTAVTKFSLAVNRRFKDRNTNELKEETEWFNIVAWERLAETCNTYLHKGSKVYIEGRMQSHTYTDKDGVQRRVWDVIATDMRMLDSKDQSAPGPQRIGAKDYADDFGAEDIPF